MSDAPRGACRLLSGTNDDEGLAGIYQRGVLGQDGDNLAGHFGGNLGHHLHGHDDADRLADLDDFAHLDERRFTGLRRAVERTGDGTDQRDTFRQGRLDRLAVGVGVMRGEVAQGVSGGRGVGLHLDANGNTVFVQGQPGEAVALHHVDQIADLLRVHRGFSHNTVSVAPRPWGVQGADGLQSLAIYLTDSGISLNMNSYGVRQPT